MYDLVGDDGGEEGSRYFAQGGLKVGFWLAVIDIPVFDELFCGEVKEASCWLLPFHFDVDLHWLFPVLLKLIREGI